MYSEGSFFHGLFAEFPDIIIRITAKGILASGEGFLISDQGSRPDDEEFGRIWDYMQSIRDLM